MKKKFEIHDLRFPTEVLGIQIRRDETGIYFSTRKSEAKIIEEYEINDPGVLNTPLPPGHKLPPLDELPDVVVICKCRGLLGKLLCLSRYIRFDICCAVNFLSRYSMKHNKAMCGSMKGILRCLKKENFEIYYAYNKILNNHGFHLTARSDASFSDDLYKRRSTIGLFFSGMDILTLGARRKLRR